MKIALRLSLALACLFLAAPASAANPAACYGIVLKKMKISYDAKAAGLPDIQGFAACRGPGYSCRSSLDCCGGTFCNNGSCGDNGNACRGAGAACRSSLDCCGAASCTNGYCGDSGNNCRQEGAKCKSSLDCCGSNFCTNGFCG